MLTEIRVKHNMEMAHRLSQSPGKCERIHGHSWWVTLSIRDEPDPTGKVLEFGAVKKVFREFLDKFYDHHILLNEDDYIIGRTLPGLHTMQGDPTTENIARDILIWAIRVFSGTGRGGRKFRVEVWETATNCAIVGDF